MWYETEVFIVFAKFLFIFLFRLIEISIPIECFWLTALLSSKNYTERIEIMNFYICFVMNFNDSVRIPHHNWDSIIEMETSMSWKLALSFFCIIFLQTTEYVLAIMHIELQNLVKKQRHSKCAILFPNCIQTLFIVLFCLVIEIFIISKCKLILSIIIKLNNSFLNRMNKGHIINWINFGESKIHWWKREMWFEVIV